MGDKPREAPTAERAASGCPSRGTRSQHVVDTKNSKSETRNPTRSEALRQTIFNDKNQKSPKTKRNLLQSPGTSRSEFGNPLFMLAGGGFEVLPLAQFFHPISRQAELNRIRTPSSEQKVRSVFDLQPPSQASGQKCLHRDHPNERPSPRH
jgi:hypothetical protein